VGGKENTQKGGSEDEKKTGRIHRHGRRKNHREDLDCWGGERKSKSRYSNLPDGFWLRRRRKDPRERGPHNVRSILVGREGGYKLHTSVIGGNKGSTPMVASPGIQRGKRDNTPRTTEMKSES